MPRFAAHPRLPFNGAALFESARVGVDALRANPTRTLLATVGVVIGVAALVAAFAITDGVDVWARSIVARESSVQDIVVSPVTAVVVNGRTFPVRGYPIFTPEDAMAARIEVPGAVRAALLLSGSSPVQAGDRRATARLTLTTGGFDDFTGLPLAAGRFYGDAEVAHGMPVVVLGHRLARELAGARDPLWLVGRSVSFRGERREVIGVLAPPAGADEGDLVAFAPLRGGTALLEPTRAPPLPTLRLKARSIEAIDSLRVATLDWLATRYGRAVGKLEVRLFTQQLENTRQAMRLTRLLLGFLVSLILAVGGIGIMNVLLAAVAERTREIGIRKAVGARARDIQVQFLIESLVVTGAGSALGFVLGAALAIAGTAAFRHFVGSGVHAILRPTTGLLAVGSAAAVGLAFGTYPARRAARLSPLDAIARE
jgi:putative ABC transport system permease protein